MDTTKQNQTVLSRWLLSILIAAIALLSGAVFELTEQNSALRTDLNFLEATMPRLNELQHRRDAADKELAALRARATELNQTSAKAGH